MYIVNTCNIYSKYARDLHRGQNTKYSLRYRTHSIIYAQRNSNTYSIYNNMFKLIQQLIQSTLLFASNSPRANVRLSQFLGSLPCLYAKSSY